jgi:hypothetical protein
MPTYDDLTVESLVLSYVMTERNPRLTIPRLVWELAGELEDEDGAIERAVRELVRARLLRCEGGFLRPDLADLRFVAELSAGSGQASL